MIRVHVNDPLEKEAMEVLKSKPQLEVTCEHFDKDKLLAVMPEIEVLIVRSATKVTSELIERGTKLRLICRAGVGLDNIDVEDAQRKGIKVLNTPGASAISVAELTFGLMLSAARHIARGTVDLKNGLWKKKELEGVELFNKTLGIIGLGTIGKEVAKRAIAFGMNVVAYDPYVKHFEGVKLTNLDELYAVSDFITLHVPLTKETKHLIKAALYEALVARKVYAAALDVFEVEPPNDELRKKLLQLPNVVATPHIGASTIEAQSRVAKELLQKLFEELKI